MALENKELSIKNLSYLFVLFIPFFCFALTNSEKLIDSKIPQITNKLIRDSESGDLEASYKLALAQIHQGYTNNDHNLIQSSHQKFAELAKKGHVPSMYIHGYKYRHSYTSVSAKELRFVPNEGIEWIKQAAQKNYAPALFELGIYYLHELGLEFNIRNSPQDLDKAFDYFSKASEEGSRYALIKLAEMFFEGRAVRKDSNQAYLLYQDVAQKGIYSAYSTLAIQWHSEEGLDPNKEKYGFYWNLFKNNDRHIWCGEDEAGIDYDCGDRKQSWIYGVFLYHGEFI